jgi:cellulose synthase/poly-beta-1,6-N-acetylglucosamine synthase-like glycosyltransferase
MTRSPALLLLAFAVWLTVISITGSALSAMLAPFASTSLRFLWTVVVVHLAYFWLLASYHAVTFFISLFYRSDRYDHAGCVCRINHKPAVAILLTTRNDFIPECADTCISVEYRDSHLFICDDSDQPEARAAIGEYASRYAKNCTVVRRVQARGFKAGNLNHALAKLPRQYEYVLIVDSDSRLPPDIVPRLLVHFDDRPQVAFVQARQTGWVPKGSSLGNALTLGVNVLWSYVCLRNRFGFVPSFGHGVMVKTEALRAIGGFPEVVSEDLAMAIRLRRNGFIGIIAPNSTSEEGLPASLAQFRRRYEKWTVGLLEGGREIASWMRSRDSGSWIEKADCAVHALLLVGFIPLLSFILLINVLIPLVYGIPESVTIETPIIGLPAVSFPILSTRHLFAVQTSSSMSILRAVVFGSIIAPLLYFLPISLRRPALTLRHIAVAYACFCAVILPLCLSIGIFLATGRAWYRTTGDASEDRIWDTLNNPGAAELFKVGRLGSIVVETISVFLLFCIGLWSANLFLLSLTTGMILGPIHTLRANADSGVGLLWYVPGLLFGFQLVAMGISGLGYAGLFSYLVVIHF